MYSPSPLFHSVDPILITLCCSIESSRWFWCALVDGNHDLVWACFHLRPVCGRTNTKLTLPAQSLPFDNHRHEFQSELSTSKIKYLTLSQNRHTGRQYSGTPGTMNIVDLSCLSDARRSHGRIPESAAWELSASSSKLGDAGRWKSLRLSKFLNHF